MDHSFIIRQLSQNRNVFQSLFSGLDKEEYTWKPAPEKWSLLEVLCHLYDEEREDFRARLKHTLETPSLPLPKIDPPGWVKERKYAEWDYAETLNKLLAERERSVQWLLSLRDPSWKNTHVHPKFGDLSAEMFLTNWLAHDHLHIRQITKLKYDRLKNRSTVRMDYAGEW